jgi:hypothetical protein
MAAIVPDRYMRNMTAEGIAEYLTVKLAETTEDDVFPFNTELLKDEFPVFVKFYENWCSRCQQMKSAFEYAASKTLGRVMFMEVGLCAQALVHECLIHDVLCAFCDASACTCIHPRTNTHAHARTHARTHALRAGIDTHAPKCAHR